METERGQLLVVRREYPLSYRHGGEILRHAFAVSHNVLALIVPEALSGVGAQDFLFLDTETTGLAGGTGTYAFLVGAGKLQADRFVVTQFFMRDFDDEPALLAALASMLAGVGGLVTFNGSGFDLPLLETRFVLGRRRWPGPLPHLDLLWPARRIWAGDFGDCRLATLEREVLGLVREHDVPGPQIPALYFDFLRYRRPGRLATVFSHNREDVLSLVALLAWLGRGLACDEPARLRVPELAGLGRIWERRHPERAAVYYREALARALGGSTAHWVRLRLARLEKRRARWEEASALWELAARSERFDPRPWEELAKFHEHRRRDLTAAHEIVGTALGLAEQSGAPLRILEAFTHRLRRLERRLVPTH